MAIGNLTLYFSYQTVVAVEGYSTGEFYISENMWSTTTGRHINCINRDKDVRLPREVFEEKLDEILDRYNLGGE